MVIKWVEEVWRGIHRGRHHLEFNKVYMATCLEWARILGVRRHLELNKVGMVTHLEWARILGVRCRLVSKGVLIFHRVEPLWAGILHFLRDQEETWLRQESR